MVRGGKATCLRQLQSSGLESLYSARCRVGLIIPVSNLDFSIADFWLFVVLLEFDLEE